MKLQMIMPQEVEVFYVIPTIRREMALVMKSSGKKQKEIAKLLCVEESTISQYVNNKRAAEIRLNERIKKAVADSAGNVKDKASLVSEMQKILKLIKEDNALCDIHRAVADMPEACDTCILKK
jgi:predicted transcriptional regulator